MLLALLHAENLLDDLIGGGHLAAAVAGEINGLGAVECQLHVLQHLALVQLHVQDGLDGILAGGLADGVVGEGPHGDGTDQTHVDALGLQLGNGALGNTGHGAEGGDDVLRIRPKLSIATLP